MNKLIKGRDLKRPLYKVIKENNKHFNMVYKEGWNEDIIPFMPEGECKPGALFCRCKKYI